MLSWSTITTNIKTHVVMIIYDAVLFYICILESQSRRHMVASKLDVALFVKNAV